MADETEETKKIITKSLNATLRSRRVLNIVILIKLFVHYVIGNKKMVLLLRQNLILKDGQTKKKIQSIISIMCLRKLHISKGFQ